MSDASRPGCPGPGLRSGGDPPGEPGFAGFSPDIAWQRYNPYPKLQVRGIPDSWVFASNDAPGDGDSLSADQPITSGLAEILFPVPGVIEPAPESDHQFIPLVRTGDRSSGMMRFEAYRENQQNPLRLAAEQGPPRGKSLVLAAMIGIYIGMVSAWNRGRSVDRLYSWSSLTLYSMPEWWLGLLLIAGFSVGIGPLPGLFPTGGLHSVGVDPTSLKGVLDTAWHLVLPVVTLTLAYLADYERKVDTAAVGDTGS